MKMALPFEGEGRLCYPITSATIRRNSVPERVGTRGPAGPDASSAFGGQSLGRVDPIVCMFISFLDSLVFRAGAGLPSEVPAAPAPQSAAARLTAEVLPFWPVSSS